MSDAPDKATIDGALETIKGFIERGEYDNAYRGCTEVLKVDPGNQLAQTLKAELEKRRAIMETGAASGASARALNCPACNASINIQREDSETLTCSTCGAVLDLESDDLKVLDKLNPKQFAPESFIRLGKTCKFQGKEYQVIGRLCYNSDIREWDPEDHCYYTAPWSFDEWVLVGENKEYIYLGEDAEGYSVSFPFTPTKPGLPQPSDTRMSLFKDRPERLIQEMGTATVSYFEGEFTWRPKTGDAKKWAEYQDDQAYSVEWRVDAEGKPLEVEFFKSQSIPRLHLAYAFNEREIIEEEQRSAKQAEEYKWWSWAFFGASVLCMLLLLVSCGSSGKKVASYTVNISQLSGSGVIRGPFEMKRKGAIYSLVLKSSIPDNSSAWAGVELLDEAQQPLNVVEGDFWRESGYDSDGSWSESYVKQERLFKLTQPGRFFIQLHGEPGTARSGSVSLEVMEGVGISRYYLISMLLCLGFGVAIRQYKTLNPLYVVVGLLAIGFFILSNIGDD